MSRIVAKGRMMILKSVLHSKERVGGGKVFLLPLPTSPREGEERRGGKLELMRVLRTTPAYGLWVSGRRLLHLKIHSNCGRMNPRRCH